MGLRLRWPWQRAGEAATAPAVDTGDALARLRGEWDAQGFVVLPAFYGAAELEPAEAEVRNAWDDKAPRIVVDDLVTNQRLRLCDVDEQARRQHRFKTNDLYLESASVRALALNDRITPILAALLGHTPVLCNSLSFEQGSGQIDHVDALYMTPRSQHHLIAIWVALEDCHVDAGPLRYFPGSHRIPPHVFSTGSNHFVQEEMGQWADYMQRECAARGLQPETFAARKGDVFIWSAYLLHGGSPIADASKTRKSVVFHYYSEEDCIAQDVTLVPESGAYWMHRRHQDVPGLGLSDAPPIPLNARIAA